MCEKGLVIDVIFTNDSELKLELVLGRHVWFDTILNSGTGITLKLKITAFPAESMVPPSGVKSNIIL